MNIHALKQRITSNPKLKRIIHYLIMNPKVTAPRRWIKWFVNPLVFKHGKGSKIHRHVILNISPINLFSLGDNSIIEYFSILDNAVGIINIGNNTRVGLNNTIIGPVQIGSNTILAQNIVLSGLNHNYQDIHVPVKQQGVNTAPIIIGNDCWIGANSIITSGVHVGKHVIVAGGSVVTKDIPDYCVVAGNPAKIIKQYDFEKQEWIKML